MSILDKLFNRTPKRVAGKKGKLPVKPVTGVDLVDFLTDPLEPGLPVVTAPKNHWAMLGNGPDASVTNQGPDFEGVGDCTMAGVVHLSHAVALVNKLKGFKWPSANAVVAQYFKLTGGQDTGLDMVNVLQNWVSPGLFGQDALAWAKIDFTDPNMIRSAVTEFNAVYLGVNLPYVASDQFNAGQPWALTGTSQDNDIDGGHCIPIIGYDSTYVYVVTWGFLQACTWAWIAKYAEEAYVVLTAENALVNLTGLQAAIAALNG